MNVQRPCNLYRMNYAKQLFPKKLHLQLDDFPLQERLTGTEGYGYNAPGTHFLKYQCNITVEKCQLLPNSTVTGSTIEQAF